MSIYKKLFEAKKEIGKISKDSTNPFFKSKYFDINGLLEHVEPILEKHGLLLLQPVLDGKVKTIICDVNNEDGKMDNVVSEMKLPTIQDPQKLGSAITYYRRYTLQSLLGLQAEDDDGNSAKKQLEKEKKQHAINLLNGSKDLKELQTNYLSLSKEQQVANVSLKDELKIKLK